MVTRLQLAYVPITYSEHVYLNGVEQPRSDWTLDAFSRVTIDSTLTVTGDRLECRYAHMYQAHAPVTYTSPTVVGVPWGYLNGFSGTRTCYFRLEGIEFAGAGVDQTLVNCQMGQSFGGPGSFDNTPGSYAVVCTDQGYADNIYRHSITRPYTEPGEAPFTEINVFLGDWYHGPNTQALPTPVPIAYHGDAGSPPPTSYQG